MGNQLLTRFKEILDEERVYNLSEGGPEKALAEHRGTENLRIIGKTKKMVVLNSRQPNTFLSDSKLFYCFFDRICLVFFPKT